MRRNERFEDMIRKDLDVRASEGTYDRMREFVLHAHEPPLKTSPARGLEITRRIMMDKRLVKLAVAATVVAAIVLGVFEFVNTGRTSGVVWAEVAQKVQACSGLVVRCTEITSFLSSDADYAIKYFSPTRARTDYYQDGQITQTFYDNSEALTLTGVYHTRKHYLTTHYSGPSEGFLERQEDWMDPRYLVQRILSCEHRELGQKTIEGVLCEGLETTDPAVLAPLPGPVERLEVQMRLWVDAETQYPLRFESKMSGEAEGQTLASEWVMDQFQWDVELERSIFEPNIPPDYEDMRNL